MSSRDLHLAAIAVVLLTGAHPPSARGDDDLTALLSEPMETTAGKSAGTAAAAPALSISITAEDLRRHGIRTLAEVYNFLGMGLVSEDPLGEPEVGGRGLMFTGDQNKHILLLIDGHTTNDQESGASLHGRSLGLPLELIDHIEIVLGPGSVLYGSNAMLGVVNLVTKRAKDYSGVHIIVSGATSPPMDGAHGIIKPAPTSQYLQDLGREYRLGLGGGHEFELRGIPAELTAQLEYYTLEGPTMEWVPQLQPQQDFGPRTPRGSWGGQTRNSYYARVPSGYARLIVGDFEATAHLVASRISQPYLRRKDQSAAGGSGDFDDPDGARVQRYAGLELKWRRNVSTVATVMSRLYSDWTTNTSQFHDHSFFGCLDGRSYIACARSEAGYARSIGTELQWVFDWTANGSMTTMVGGDGRLRQVGYQNGSTDVTTGQSLVYSHFNDTAKVVAIYAQHVYRPVRSLTANLGARWDVDDRSGSRLLPRAALIWEPWSGGTIKAIYSQAFRAPTADELYYRSPLSALASQGLQSESVRSIEAILQQRIGTQSIVFGVFRSWWSDMIVQRELRNLVFQARDEGAERIAAAKRAGLLDPNVLVAFQYENVASIDNFGFNGGYDGTLLGGRLAYGLNLTAGYARLNTPEGTRRVPVTPSMFGNARVSYDLSNRLPVVAMAAHFSDRRLSDAGEDAGFRPLPFAPAALDLRTTIAGPFPRVKRLTYLIMGNYAFSPSSPYTAGPSSLNATPLLAPPLAPTVRFTLMFGLLIDLHSLR